MFKASDLEQLKEKGIAKEQVENQIQQFKDGFPDLEIIKPATTKDGIKKLTDNRLAANIKVYNKASRRLKRTKFVPASGAASRMFKALFEILNSYEGTEEEYLKLTANREFGSFYYMCEHLDNFAFFPELIKVIEDAGSTLEECAQKKDFILLLKSLLTEDGLNYGGLPKGLLRFHKGPNNENRTPVEEQLVEGANYAKAGRKVKVHFTVSPQHLSMFQAHLTEVVPKYEKQFKVKYEISFSIQKPETDTVAVDLNNKVFRDEQGELVFRPGGHGALIQNVNELDADLVFIKNIDNVIQDRIKPDTYTYKKALAGMLLWHRDKVFEYIKKLNKKYKQEVVDEALVFMKRKLNIIVPDEFCLWHKQEQVDYLLVKLNRPIRVCGMVRNQGEPGGGPYWVRESDGAMSLQVVEESQISDEYKPLMEKATHFNPVDLVCYIKDYKGKKFDLNQYVDKRTGFISEKSVQGKTVKALELPGLWNGAMADWISIFVEVPVSTFSPVKTIYDLLREEHLFENDLLKSKESKFGF